MLTSITITQVYVPDQDAALEFYVGKLGMVVREDMNFGPMRWLTVMVPGQPDRAVLLERPGPPAMSEETAAEVRAILTKGAAGDGVVLRAGAASGFGLAVYILHENGDVTVYGHMDEILVDVGQYVDAGDTIALLGNRGQSTGPHLHFEVHVGGIDGTKVDPIPWLRERGVQI